MSNDLFDRYALLDPADTPDASPDWTEVAPVLLADIDERTHRAGLQRHPAGEAAPQWRWRGVRAAAVAFMVVVVLGFAWFIGAAGTDVADQRMSETVPPVPRGGDILETSGDYLWAWDDDGNRLRRYAGGRWQELPPVPESSRFVGASAGGTPWVFTDNREMGSRLGWSLSYFDAGTWHRLDVIEGYWSVTAGPSPDVMWLSDSEQLWRRDGGDLTMIGSSLTPDWLGDPLTYIRPRVVGRMAVTRDGTLWVGYHSVSSMRGGLASFEYDTWEWEAVRPWDGKEALASDLVPTRSGGLWALLEHWDEEGSPAESFDRWAIAYRDGDTGRWDVYDEGLPDGHPNAMAADSHGVWIAQGDARHNGLPDPDDAGSRHGLYHFDGHTWTHYLDGIEVSDVAVAPDGTVWYVPDQEPYALETLNP